MSPITATFESRPQAEAALALLEGAGVRDDQVSMVVNDESLGDHIRFEPRARTDESAAAGATFGGVAGALLGTMLAAGSIAVPGLNLVVVGSLASGLAGLGAGAAAGGVVGALIGAGMTEHEARLHDDADENGNILMAVQADSDVQMDNIENILRNSEAHDIVH